MSKKLASHFKFSGKVIDGEKVGRKIGFPTANLDFLPDELDEGVYLGTVKIREKEFYCLAYYGPRFIFGEIKNNFEVYVYDFDEKIYGQILNGELKYFLRTPLKMKDLEELKSQLQQDRNVGSKLITTFKKH